MRTSVQGKLKPLSEETDGWHRNAQEQATLTIPKVFYLPIEAASLEQADPV